MLYIIINFVILLIIITNIYTLKHLILSRNQYNQLIKFKNSPFIKTNDKNKINLIFYKYFEKYAIKKAVDFKKLHRFKCKNIHTDELIFASRIGLYKAAIKFNGSSPFTKFSEIYIRSELYNLVSDTYSLSILPRNYRKNSKTNLTDIEKITYKKLLKTSLYDEEYKFNNLRKMEIYNYNNDIINKYKKLELLRSIWIDINKMDIFSKRIFHLKYNFLFNKQQSNKRISKLMCCSEEYVRKKENYVKQILKKKYME